MSLSAWRDALVRMSEERGTILTFGMDPVLERIPNEYGKGIEERITAFFSEICDALLEENLIVAIKPNYAFYAQYGFEGLRALKTLITRYRKKAEVILDGKRGDIGKSALAYAREAEFWGAHALTASPYVWEEGLRALAKRVHLYVLCRTTNPGAEELQTAKTEKGEIWHLVAEMTKRIGAGVVVGAKCRELSALSHELPCLIPGVGAQGGTVQEVMENLHCPKMHRITVSSSLSYAYEKHRLSPERSAVKEARLLVEEIKKSGTAEIRTQITGSRSLHHTRLDHGPIEESGKHDHDAQ